MIYYFKKSKRLYLAGCVLSFILSPAVVIPLDGLFHLRFDGLPLLLLLLFVGQSIFAAAGNTIADREHKKLLAPLADKCDPDLFVSVYAPFVFDGNIPYNKMAPFVVNLCQGYMEKGDDKLAAQTLLCAVRAERKPQDSFHNGLVYCCLAEAMAHQGSQDAAAQYLQGAKLTLGRTSGKPRLYNALFQNITRCEHRFGQTGSTPEQHIYYWEQGLLVNPLSQRNKTNIHWQLAELCAKTGDAQKAIKHCRYVLEHGNKLRCVPEARELLETLEQQ